MDNLFYIFASLALTSSAMVVSSRNPVYSVMFLVLTFFQGAALVVLLGLDFFAMTLLVVYVGAIAVLFLFVVMMLDVNLAHLAEQRLRYLPVAGVLAVLFALQVVAVVDQDVVPRLAGWGWMPQYTLWGAGLTHTPTIESLGRVLYTHHALGFVLASLVLLVAMVAAIVLTQTPQGVVRRQDALDQNTRDAVRTIRTVTRLPEA